MSKVVAVAPGIFEFCMILHDLTAINLSVASWPTLKPLETGFGIEPFATVCFNHQV